MRLVDPVRQCSVVARTLCISACRFEQKRSYSGKTAAGPKESKESVLRDDLRLGYSAALRSAFWRLPDHRLSDGTHREVKVVSCAIT